MASKASALDATIQQKWEETLSASHEPDKTISANLEPTRRITKNSLSESVHRLGYEMGFKHVESGPLVRSSYHASDAV